MKARLVLFSICCFLLTILGCNRSFDFFDKINIEDSSYTIILYTEKKNVIVYSLPVHIDKEVKGNLFKEFSEKVKNKREKIITKAEPPFYALYLKRTDGKDCSVAWTDSIVSFSDGSSCQASLDFWSIINEYAYQKTSEYINKVPADYSSFYWFLKNKNMWKTEYLEQAFPEIKHDISLEMSLDGKKTGVMKAIMKNEGKDDYVYGAPLFELYLVDNMNFYRIPTLPGVDFGADSVGYLLRPGEEILRTYDVKSIYGTLPRGEYLLVDSNVSATFKVDKRGRLQINTEN